MKMPALRTAIAVFFVAASAATAFAQPGLTKEQVERRYNVRVFGSVLVSAANHGAELMALRVRQIDPGVILFSGTTPRAQGFVIDGYGVFFHVEIPNVDSVAAWTVTNRGRDQIALQALSDLKRMLEAETDPMKRQMLESNIRSLTLRLLPPGALQQQERQMQTTGAIPLSGVAASAPPPPPPVMTNPNLEYERLVMEELSNAMLDHSHQLGLGTDEWLTVAARGTQGPLIPEAVFDDSVTITLRIKGSDLAEFRAGRITRDEARARIVVREF